MTGLDPYLPPRRFGVLRDVLAIVLILVGVAAAVFVGLHVPWQVNVAAGSVVAIAAGLALGMTR